MLPQASEQILIFKEHISHIELSDGDFAYLISLSWLRKWRESVGYFPKSSPTKDCPPIDNSDLLEDGSLKKLLMEGIDHQIVKKEMWDLFVKWYGGGPEIKVEVAYDPLRKQNIPVLKFLNLNIIYQENSYKIEFSKYKKVSDLLEMIHEKFGIDIQNLALYENQNEHKRKLFLSQTLLESYILDNQQLLLEEDDEKTQKKSSNSKKSKNSQKVAKKSNPTKNTKNEIHKTENNMKNGKTPKSQKINEKNEKNEQKEQNEQSEQNEQNQKNDKKPKNDKKTNNKPKNVKKPNNVKEPNSDENDDDSSSENEINQEKAKRAFEKIISDSSSDSDDSNDTTSKNSTTNSATNIINSNKSFNNSSSPNFHGSDDLDSSYESENNKNTFKCNSQSPHISVSQSSPRYLNIYAKNKNVYNSSSPLKPNLPNSPSQFNFTPNPNSKNIKGTCGFNNLGNTCFLNSALQCILHTMPLVNYFLTENWKSEISYDNPLGTKGMCASAFSIITDRVWNVGSVLITPNSLLNIIQKHAPHLSGNNQQDAHELILLLLDMIHEDLNRIKKKPNIENVEGNGENDEEIAEESWRRYKMRNDSIIVDTFHGQLRSKLTCPKCKQTVVTFEPFISISLPILPPSELYPICFVPYEPRTQQIYLKLPIPLKSSIEDFKKALFLELNYKCDIAFAFVNDNGSIEIESEPRPPTKNAKTYVFEIPPTKGLYIITRLGVKVKKLLSKRERLFPDLYLIEIPDEDPSHDKLVRICKKRFSYLWKHLRPPRKPNVYFNYTYKDDSSSDHSDAGKDDENGSLANNHLVEALKKKEIVNISESSCFKVIPSHRGHYPRHKKCYFLSSTFIKVLLNGKYMKDVEVPKETPNKKELIKFNWHRLFRPYTGSAHITNSKFMKASIESFLRAFSSTNKLDEDNKWYCPKCKDHVCADKKLDIWSLPNCLVINFKRFIFNGKAYRKNNTNIIFPDRIDMSPYVCGTQGNEPLLYELYSVVQHHGALDGGHYTANTFVEGVNKWYFFNDHIIKQEPIENAHMSSAYVLFYKRLY
ncbi:hypothetical protein TRFO_03231 [Tritrichomonas foetus]|uniref:ubiquitinyl hydrolase 1 n=1 Tax=Tritrichomonas foetus TaxID=1144522 RepID=A0A1J4KSB0_9EUKA|nr:hypothetical protein TRFO_03231 [Tritrichomonas foetus]|eukprot:OHT14167.1 hypothetical protein TRFO_03231 [Tritrichomonas foetus]